MTNSCHWHAQLRPLLHPARSSASPSTCSASASGAALKTDETADRTRFETQVLPRWLKNFQITAAGKPVEGAFRQKVGGPQAPYGTADVRAN